MCEKYSHASTTRGSFNFKMCGRRQLTGSANPYCWNLTFERIERIEGVELSVERLETLVKFREMFASEMG